MRAFRANAGTILEADDGHTVFVFDAADRQKIMRKTREWVPQQIPVRLFCNPTFPILAPIGGFVHPERGACWPTGLPSAWQWAWRRA